MPKASLLQPAFSGGEFSPRAQGRSDSERYKVSVEKSLNYLPAPEGPQIRRPGLNYTGANAKDPSKPPNFIEFKFSQNQNYVLEFGDLYLRFFTNEAQITTTSTHFKVSGYYGTSDTPIHSSNFYAMRSDPIQRPGELLLASSIINASSVLEIQSPYSYPDVFDLKISQKEDTLYIVHSSYPVYKLQRFGNELWTIKTVFNQDGPYLPINSYRTPGDSLSVTFSGVQTPFITSPANVSQYDLVTGPARPIANIITGSSNIRRVITVGNHNFQSGDRVVIRDVSGAGDVVNGTSSIATMFWQIIKINATTFDLVGSSNSGFSYVGSGFVYPALFEPYITSTDFNDIGRKIALIRTDGGRAWGTIDTVTDMSRARVIVDANISPAVNGSTVTYWQLGTWDRSNGYPNAIAHHQDRLMLGGVPQYPQQFTGSVIGEYENFQLSGSSGIVTDDSGLQFSLATNKLETIKWLVSDKQGLLAGTASAEWAIAPSNNNGVLTPTNVSARTTSDFGSHNAQAVRAGNAVLYIQGGQRKVRELNYFYQVDTYRSTDISELADHLTIGGVKKLVVQKEPIPIIWALREDGVLVAVLYGRDDETLKVGWASTNLGGASDSAGTVPVVTSVAVIPSPDGLYEQLWCGVRRFINGTSVVTIETMQSVFNEATLQEDAQLLDCSGTYDFPVTITGLTNVGSAVVTAASHGFSNGDSVLITKVVGLNSSVTDINGYVHTSSLVNYRSFTVASSATNSFWLQDFGSSFINANSYGAYFSGGEVRKFVSTVSGFTWLKNESVDVLADGKIHGKATVNSAGVLTLSYPACKVQVGYAYKSQGKSLRQDAGSGDGSALGKLRRVARAAFLLRHIGDFKFGPSFDKLTTMADIESYLADATANQQHAALFSGVSRDSLESEFDYNGQVCWEQSSPLPGMVLNLDPMIEENDV